MRFCALFGALSEIGGTPLFARFNVSAFGALRLEPKYTTADSEPSCKTQNVPPNSADLSLEDRFLLLAIQMHVEIASSEACPLN